MYVQLGAHKHIHTYYYNLQRLRARVVTHKSNVCDLEPLTYPIFPLDVILELVSCWLPLPLNHLHVSASPSLFLWLSLSLSCTFTLPAAKKSLMGEFDNIYTDSDSTPRTDTHTYTAPSSLSTSLPPSTSIPVSSSKPYVSTNSTTTQQKSSTGENIKRESKFAVWKKRTLHETLKEDERTDGSPSVMSHLACRILFLTPVSRTSSPLRFFMTIWY